jgi:hypothetical protein
MSEEVKIEPCRATVDGKRCGREPILYGTGEVRCRDHFDLASVANWNALQIDRRDAARWRALMALHAKGTHLVCEVSHDGESRDLAARTITEILDAAIGEGG